MIEINCSWIDSGRGLADIARKLATEWFKGQSQEAFAAYYLYYRPSAHGLLGALAVETEPPSGWQIARAERISPAWTEDQTQGFIESTIRRLPILPVA